MPSSLTNLNSRLLVRSQDERPGLLLDVLVVTAVKESWVNLLVNAHVALFFGLLLLASNYDIDTGVIFGGIHLAANLLAALIVGLLLRIPADRLISNLSTSVFWLTVSDVIVALAWGISIMLFFYVSDYAQYNTLVVVLLAAGISSAALSAKLIRVLMLGRFLVFAPTLMYLIKYQPPEWLLHTTSLTLCFTVCVGVGYAIHVQLLREASTVVELNHSRAEVVHEATFRENFLKSITHDLRQPLSSMSLFIRSLERKSIDSGEEIIALKQCLDASERVLESVSQLAWVKQELPRPTVKMLDISEVMAPLVVSAQVQAAEKGIELKHIPSRLKVIGEAQYIERAIRNLMDNAVHYTTHGRVLIGARYRSLIGMVEIQVWDTGMGVTVENQRQIFDAYQRITDYSTIENGSHLGLGLSIVKGVAASLNGHVELTSELGKGSCFSLFLPGIVELKTDCFAGLHFVIIDDDASYAHTVQNALIQTGASVSVITDLEQITKANDEGFEDCDMAVIDYRLTDSITGFDLFKNYSNYQYGVLISNAGIPINNSDYLNPSICLLRKTTDEYQLIQLLAYAIQYSHK